MSAQRDTKENARAEMTIADVAHRTSGVQESSERRMYQPLDLTADSIRVIHVLPGPEQSVIRCTLQNTTIAETTYACLSYTWNPSSPEHMIEVEGCPLLVGDNLYQFLHAFRSCNVSLSLDETSELCKLLWIDAISINQNDSQEKNHQVRQMGAIYHAAVEVIIWLGVLGPGLDQLFEDFTNTHDMCSHIATWPCQANDIICAQLKQRIGCMEPSRKAKLQERMDSFLKLPYWDRVWIAQEILSRSDRSGLFVFSGKRLFDMFHLREQVLAITDAFGWHWQRNDKGKMLASQEAVPMCIKYLLWLCPGRHGSKDNGASLPSLLTQFYYCGCRDKRDRVFALLSLAHRKPHIKVDYEVEPTALFQTTLESFMDAEPLDKVLRLGASLIQALGIRRTSCKAEHTVPQYTVGEHDEGEDPRLLITRPISGVVARPIWAESVLELPHEEHAQSPATTEIQHPIMCMYVGIFYAHNLHVFEYAVEEGEDEVEVRYARAYDYLRGVPEQHEIPNPSCHCGKSSLMWLDLPSEKIHYLRGPFDSFQWMRNPPLVAWRSREFQFVEAGCKDRKEAELFSSDNGTHRLVPALRTWKEDVLWSGGLEYHWHSMVFLSAHEVINATIESLPPSFLEDGDQLMPLHPRATKIVIFNEVAKGPRVIDHGIDTINESPMGT